MARILQYEGISPISRSISFLTWNRTTHTAWEFDDGRVVEAWGGDHVNAVRITKNFAHGHTPGTIVKAYKLPTLSANQKHNIECYLHQQVGKPYNWRGCLRPPPRCATRSCTRSSATSCRSGRPPPSTRGAVPQPDATAPRWAAVVRRAPLVRSDRC